jgi:hypothetical protein
LRGFLLLPTLLFSCCALGLCAFLCWILIHHCIRPNMLHLTCCSFLGFSLTRLFPCSTFSCVDAMHTDIPLKLPFWNWRVSKYSSILLE